MPTASPQQAGQLAATPAPADNNSDEQSRWWPNAPEFTPEWWRALPHGTEFKSLEHGTVLQVYRPPWHHRVSAAIVFTLAGAGVLWLLEHLPALVWWLR